MESENVLPRSYKVKPGRMTGVYIAVLITVAAGLLPVLKDEGLGSGAKTLIIGLLLAFVVWIVTAARLCATYVDRSGIRVRGMIRTRRLAWEEIRDISSAPNPSAGLGQGQPQVISYARGRDGRRVQLMYLDDKHVTVDREIAALRSLWEELRGEDWTPDAA
ncbi:MULTISPECIES: PH domain-containing protein [unclassified Streptomyces]|uniref:PH domain-containing protein n=1 Tax=unclassified Streptomyces TaxID=2593676 RepID=UPI00166102BA|nr:MULTISPECIES: PH domain-containing protein [unclassified Streptomyces]MBD0707283.1 hypothetical protein [Streptomyces sp. CBMA291]MBD0713771.1 hypothetical protein [Streptomyces sp. CBMA370]